MIRPERALLLESLGYARVSQQSVVTFDEILATLRPWKTHGRTAWKHSSPTRLSQFSRANTSF